MAVDVKHEERTPPAPSSATVLRGGADAWAYAERLVALGAVFVIGSRYMLRPQIAAGYLVAFALAPLWQRYVRQSRSATVTFVVTGLCLVSGTLLAQWRSEDHSTNAILAVTLAIELAGTVSCAGLVLWAFHKVGVIETLAVYGFAMLLFVNRHSDLYSSGPWRFGYALPTMVLTLALAGKAKRRWVEIVVLLGFIAASMVTGSRSPVAVQGLAFLILWYWVRKSSSRRESVLTWALRLGFMGLVVYNLGQALMVEGFLGEAAQARTEAQLRTSGVLLLGGRPELAATLSLMKARIWGFGLGVMPNWSDVQTARNGMALIGYDPVNGYVYHYIFGGTFRLHSVFGEMWAAYGLPGLVLVGCLIWASISLVAIGRRERSADGLVLVLAFLTLWNAFFSPWYTSISATTLVLALAWYRHSEQLPRRQRPSVWPPPVGARVIRQW